MTFTTEQLEHLARLARLRLEPEDLTALHEDLEAILGYVEILSQVEVSQVEPTTHAVPLTPELREDRVEQRLSPEDILSNAPAVEDGQFQVPRVVDG